MPVPDNINPALSIPIDGVAPYDLRDLRAVAVSIIHEKKEAVIELSTHRVDVDSAYYRVLQIVLHELSQMYVAERIERIGVDTGIDTKSSKFFPVPMSAVTCITQRSPICPHCQKHLRRITTRDYLKMNESKQEGHGYDY